MIEEIAAIVGKLRGYFGAVVGGSYVLFLDKLIPFESVNDVDLLIRCNKQAYEGAVKMLVEEHGYNAESRSPVDTYGNVCKAFRLTHGELPDIHFCYQDGSKDNVWHKTVSDVLCHKMKRALHSDLLHIEAAAKELQKRCGD